MIFIIEANARYAVVNLIPADRGPDNSALRKATTQAIIALGELITRLPESVENARTFAMPDAPRRE